MAMNVASWVLVPCAKPKPRSVFDKGSCEDAGPLGSTNGDSLWVRRVAAVVIVVVSTGATPFPFVGAQMFMRGACALVAI